MENLRFNWTLLDFLSPYPWEIYHPKFKLSKPKNWDLDGKLLDLTYQIDLRE